MNRYCWICGSYFAEGTLHYCSHPIAWAAPPPIPSPVVTGTVTWTALEFTEDDRRLLREVHRMLTAYWEDKKEPKGDQGAKPRFGQDAQVRLSTRGRVKATQ